MNDAARSEAEMRLEDAQQAYRRVQAALADAEATIRRIDISIKDGDDLRVLVFWFARHAELLRAGLEAAERIAAMAAALYTPDDIPDGEGVPLTRSPAATGVPAVAMVRTMSGASRSAPPPPCRSRKVEEERCG